MEEVVSARLVPPAMAVVAVVSLITLAHHPTVAGAAPARKLQWSPAAGAPGGSEHGAGAGAGGRPVWHLPMKLAVNPTSAGHQWYLPMKLAAESAAKNKDAAIAGRQWYLPVKKMAAHPSSQSMQATGTVDKPQ